MIGLTNGIPEDTGKTGPDIQRQFRQNSDDPNWT
jgi:hypothetical protein